MRVHCNKRYRRAYIVTKGIVARTKGIVARTKGIVARTKGIVARTKGIDARTIGHNARTSLARRSKRCSALSLSAELSY